jgi:hypothetical protein
MPHNPIHSIASAAENPKPTLEQLQQTFGESGAPHVFEHIGPDMVRRYGLE